MNHSRQFDMPQVEVIGPTEHPDFAEAVAMLKSTATWSMEPATAPEVLIALRPRPIATPLRELEIRRRRWPLAGIVVVCGSWCEGELRTGRPWPGARRFYWYEFPAWWQSQMALRASGKCPDWARPVTDIYRALPPAAGVQSPGGSPCPIRGCGGVVVIQAFDRYSADALADVLHAAGLATVWQPPGQPAPVTWGALVAIWSGGQFDEAESQQFAAFCRTSDSDRTPVVALLDFPRRDRYDAAMRLGAAAVLGKPWFNHDLISTIRRLANCERTFGRAAA